MDEFDTDEVRLQRIQQPAMYRAGRTLRATFRSGDEIGGDLIALMLQLARIPVAADDGDRPSGRRR